ncbi:MAG: hypothetical protein M3552_19080 [Planctomycetota bacterium]|nr:hypothetical protein [Planctomycetota bacterium]
MTPPAAHAREVRAFRALVVTSTTAFLGYIALTWLLWYQHDDLISQETWNALQWYGYDAIVFLPAPLWYLKRVLHVAAAVGLFRFSRPARLIYTALVAFDTAMLPLIGLQVETPVAEFLLTVSYLADGAILAMAWGLPLKDRFVRL